MYTPDKNGGLALPVSDNVSFAMLCAIKELGAPITFGLTPGNVLLWYSTDPEHTFSAVLERYRGSHPLPMLAGSTGSPRPGTD